MNIGLMLILVAPLQEQYFLSPSNPHDRVRLVISVPEPLEQSMVELKLEATDGSRISTREPVLLQGKGWGLNHEGANRWILQRIDPTDRAPPGIRWLWRHDAETEWRDSTWGNLCNPAPLANIAHNRWIIDQAFWWIIAGAEGLACLLITLAILMGRWASHPARCLRRKLTGVPPGEFYWTILHQFIRAYLSKSWNCPGINVVQQWHAQRHDSNLGLRLELLLNVLAETRFSCEGNPPSPKPDPWYEWLADAEKKRSQRL